VSVRPKELAVVIEQAHNRSTKKIFLTEDLFVVPKVGSFVQCVICQYIHRAEVLSLLHIYADMGAR